VEGNIGVASDLEWKVVYVGSAESSEHDQVLDEIILVGIDKFVLQAEPPDPRRIPPNDIIGVTVVLVTCAYREREFVRIGYYVNNEYSGEYDEETGPPKPIELGKVTRMILADKPRVTRFPIPWNGQENVDASNGQVETEDAHVMNGQGAKSDEQLMEEDPLIEEEEEEEEEEDGDENMEVEVDL
jgi:histone chaperone ASF1